MATKRGTNKNNTIKGTNAKDSLFGLGGNDKLFGKGGNDKLDGGKGNDTLDGGTGADKMKGGQGNDTYIVDNAGDVVTESAGQGFDTAKSSVSHVLSANVEDLILTGAAVSGTGNTLANTITGNAGANILTGGGGNDTYIGGGGNDTYTGGSGFDTVSYAAAASRVEVYAYSVAPPPNVGDALGDSFNSIEGLIGSAFDDYLALDFANPLGGFADGGAGNDQLDGTEFSDTLIGGAGNDKLFGLEQQDSLVGGGGDDELYGNTGADTLDGGTGNNMIDCGLDTVADKVILRVGGVANLSNWDFIDGDKFVIDISEMGLSSLTFGTNFFASNAAPTNTNGVGGSPIIYNDSSAGTIYYDADGGTGNAPVIIAQGLTANLFTSDFEFIA